jgi:phenylpyruvate tautomerase PptA (4-oxalocrotonate tautomerase family)
MPLVKVNLLKGRSAEEKDSIAASIQTALVSTLEVPEADRYQLFNEYDGESFRHTSGYLGMTYTDQLVIIEITFLGVVTMRSRSRCSPRSTAIWSRPAWWVATTCSS